MIMLAKIGLLVIYMAICVASGVLISILDTI